MNKQDHTDKDSLLEVINKINELIAKSVSGDYIYRGEPECYEKVSSRLYREYEDIEVDGFDIEVVQKEILQEAEQYTTQTDEFEILTELQHYGGDTNLIDFTTDYLIALFFACDSSTGEDGRVILLENTGDSIKQPQNPLNRIIAQKSIFFRPKQGFIEREKYKVIEISKDLKPHILTHLRKSHGISTKTIYNDLHGFIRNQSIHQSAYTEFYSALTYQNKGGNEKDKATEHYNDAIKHYNQAIELNPNLAEAYYNRGVAYVSKGKQDQAIQDYSKAIELNPNLAEAYNNRGNAYADQGDYYQAIQDYSKTIELNPNLYMAYYNRGNAYADQGDYDQAIQDYSKAIELNPNLAEAYYNRGNAYNKRYNYDQAIQDYNKAIALNPNLAEAYNNRGFAYADQGDRDQAIQNYNKAIALNPNYAEAYNNRGLVYHRKGELARTIRDFNKAITLNPDYAIAYFNRGTVWLLEQAWDKAKSDLETAREKGANIAGLFSRTFGSVSAFEEQYHIQLPADIRDMLTA